MGMDKHRAIHHRYRIPEHFLFLITLCGGMLGITFGMFVFHHKIHKMKFYVINILSILIHFCIFINFDIILTK